MHAAHITMACLLVVTATQTMRSCTPEPSADPAAAEPNSIAAAVKTETPQGQTEAVAVTRQKPNEEADFMKLTEREWKQRLTSFQYHVLREKGTERPYTGKYTTHFEDGVYKCAACGEPIFASDSKFNSHCGWPAFSQPFDPNSVKESLDTSHGMIRTEITCRNCGSHLGHVFNDGPAPTGQRYCINSASMEFEEDKK